MNRNQLIVRPATLVPLPATSDPLAVVTTPEMGQQLSLVHLEKKAEIVREEERLKAFLSEMADRD